MLRPPPISAQSNDECFASPPTAGLAQRFGNHGYEDDYDSEYRYGSMPIASLQGLDSNSRVIYIGTFSKVLFPS